MDTTDTSTDIDRETMGLLSSMLQRQIRSRRREAVSRPWTPPHPVRNMVTGRWYCRDCGRDLTEHHDPHGMTDGWMCRGLGAWWPDPEHHADLWVPLDGVTVRPATVPGRCTVTLPHADGRADSLTLDMAEAERLHHEIGLFLGIQ